MKLTEKKFVRLAKLQFAGNFAHFAIRFSPKFDEIDASIIEQVASNKSSLFLKNILQSKQTLQSFTKIIKTEFIYKSN